MKTAHYRRLESRDERSIARMAARARINTICGGCSALTAARRLKRMGSKLNLEDVVSDVYSASTGRWHPQHEAWECPECGQAYLGQDAALKCCNEHDENQEGEATDPDGAVDGAKQPQSHQG